MTLRQYFRTHPGFYTLPDSHLELTLDMVSESLLDEEVEVYAAGQDPAQRTKLHIYVRDNVHVATLVQPVRVMAGIS